MAIYKGSPLYIFLQNSKRMAKSNIILNFFIFEQNIFYKCRYTEEFTYNLLLILFMYIFDQNSRMSYAFFEIYKLQLVARHFLFRMTPISLEYVHWFRRYSYLNKTGFTKFACFSIMCAWSNFAFGRNFPKSWSEGNIFFRPKI